MLLNAYVSKVESPPSRGAWIEICLCKSATDKISLSPPSRGAWIEILILSTIKFSEKVAPLAGGVD